MTYEPKWIVDLPKRRRTFSRGAPEAPERYKNSLSEHPGRWAVMGSMTSNLIAKLVRGAWTEKYPEIEFVYIDNVVFARWRTPVEPLSEAHRRTQPGETVRPGLGEKEKTSDQRMVDLYLAQNPYLKDAPFEDLVEMARDEGFDAEL